MVFLILVAILVIYITYNYIIALNYWKKRGAPSKRPWPILGSIPASILRRKPFAYDLKDMYQEFSTERYVGFHSTVLPVLLLRDPKLIKELTVKEFETFPEHRPLIPEGLDFLWSNNLFALKGDEKWHNMRSTLSPSFTSSKLRTLYQLMKECSNKFVNHFLEKGETVEVEMKEVFTKFTNDVIATTAFGISCDSLKNPQNELFLRGKSITDFGSASRNFVLILSMISPALTKLFGLKMFSIEDSNFFISIITDALRTREQKCIYRPDMINLLMEARKGRQSSEEEEHKTVDSGFAVVQESCLVKPHNSNINFNDETIAAQALIFYFAGFETTSTMMSHTAYELALNPDVQERLRQEVDDTLAKCNGNLTYEALLGMKYLDMVVTESLRKWPPAAMLDRIAVKPYIIKPERPDENPVLIEAGQNLLISVYAIHRDPKYYPDPDKFNPERFSEDNKQNVTPSAYIPFGSGPRNCIGSRFALLEGKLILTEILSKFEFVPVAKTKIPLQLSKKNFTPVPDEGFWLGLKPRGK